MLSANHQRGHLCTKNSRNFSGTTVGGSLTSNSPDVGDRKWILSDKLEGLSNYKLKLKATGREMIGKEGGAGAQVGKRGLRKSRNV